MLVYWIKENPNIIVINTNNITIQLHWYTIEQMCPLLKFLDVRPQEVQDYIEKELQVKTPFYSHLSPNIKCHQ